MKFVLCGIFLSILVCTYQLAHAQDEFVNSNDISIRFIDEGKGSPVLLVHGFTGSAKSWERSGMIDALVESGYRVIALDNRGHGRSSKPHDPAMYGMRMVHDIERLLDHLSIEQTHCFGYSMGSRLVNKFRDLYPNRCLSIILGGFAWGRASTPYSEKDIEKLMRRRGPLDGVDVVALAATRPMSQVWDLDVEAMKRNTISALLLVGDQDDRIDLTRAMPSFMPHSVVKIVPGTHKTAFSNPEFVKTALAFINSQNLQPNREQ